MKGWKTVLAAGLAAAMLCTSLGLTGCEDNQDTQSSVSTLESENWIGTQAAIDLVESLTQEQTGLSLPTEYYQFEADDEVGDIGEDTCYVIHAYLVEDGTGKRYLENTLYVTVDGSQVYTYDLNNDAFHQVWGESGTASDSQSEPVSEAISQSE